MKKLLSLFIAAILLASIAAGCGGSAKAPDEIIGAGGTDGPIIITALIVEQYGAPITGDAMTLAAVKEATGVGFDITQVAPADYAQKAQTTIASGNLPDFMSTSSIDRTEYIYAGTFMKLDDLYEEYGQAIIAKYKEMNVEKNIQFIDGSYYTVASLSSRFFGINNTINNRWLKETGQDMPKSMEEFTNTLRIFKEAKGADSIPFGCGLWAGAGGSITNMIKKTYAAFTAFYLYDEGYQFGAIERADRYKAAINWLANAYAEGLLDQNMFGTNDDEIMRQTAADKIGFFSSWADGFGLWGDGGSYGIDFIPAPVFNTEFGKGYDSVANPVTGHYVLTKSNKNPEATMWALNYIYTDEGIELMNWGIRDFTFTGFDDNRAYTDVILNHASGPVVGRYSLGMVYPQFPCYMDKEAEYVLNNPLTQEYEALIKAGNILPHQPNLTPTQAEQSEYSTIMADVNRYINDQETAFITGKVNFDAEYDVFISQLGKMGVRRAMEIRQDQYDRFIHR